MPLEDEAQLVEESIFLDLEEVKEGWVEYVTSHLEASNLFLPSDEAQLESREVHTPHLEQLLEDLQAVSRPRAGRDLVMLIPSEREIWNALGEVKDPEIPVVSVVEMGIVRTVELGDNSVTVSMTPTFSGCPALRVMHDDIEAKLREIGFEAVEVKTVLSPPWSTDWISEEAKAKLHGFGIAPART